MCKNMCVFKKISVEGKIIKLFHKKKVNRMNRKRFNCLLTMNNFDKNMIKVDFYSHMSVNLSSIQFPYKLLNHREYFYWNKNQIDSVPSPNFSFSHQLPQGFQNKVKIVCKQLSLNLNLKNWFEIQHMKKKWTKRLSEFL